MKDLFKIIGGLGILTLLALLLWLVWTDDYKFVLKLAGTDAIIIIICLVIDNALEKQ